MKTESYIQSLVNVDRDAWIKEHRDFKAAIATLEDIYGETVTGTPHDTVERFVAAVGIDMAKAVVATLVNREAWDGRIYEYVAKWAAGVKNAFDEYAATEHGYYTSRIHMAHLNQIACVIRSM